MSLITSLLMLASATSARAGGIKHLDPPEQGFYAKQLDYEGIPIKASAQVSDDALIAAYARLFMMLDRLPTARENLKAIGAELHIIGAKQSTSDLPEYRDLKGKPFDGELDVDQRTRGLGGVAASCGEENLLRLEDDRYRGRDICVHEFTHTLHVHGLSKDVQDKVSRQYEKAMAAGLWKGRYAATNEREYLAELAMWYFGTHGDMDRLPGARPGPAWLKTYDPDGYDLIDGIFTGRFEIARKRIVPLRRLPPEKERELKSHSGDPVAVTF